MVEHYDISEAGLRKKTVKRVRETESEWNMPLDQLVYFLAHDCRKSKRAVSLEIGVHYHTMGRILEVIDPAGTIDWPAHGFSADFEEAKEERRQTGGARPGKPLKMVTVDGVTRSVPEWSQITGVPADRIYHRLRRGWTEHNAIRRPAMTPQEVGAYAGTIRTASNKEGASA